jgi:hypothetical protein
MLPELGAQELCVSLSLPLSLAFHWLSLTCPTGDFQLLFSGMGDGSLVGCWCPSHCPWMLVHAISFCWSHHLALYFWCSSWVEFPDCFLASLLGVCFWPQGTCIFLSCLWYRSLQLSLHFAITGPPSHSVSPSDCLPNMSQIPVLESSPTPWNTCQVHWEGFSA